MKKWFIPILYFIFGAILYFLEDVGLGLVDDVSISLRNSLNSINLVLFILVPFAVIILMYIKGLIIFNTNRLNLVYLIYTVMSFTVISIFWVNIIQWK